MSEEIQEELREALKQAIAGQIVAQEQLHDMKRYVAEMALAVDAAARMLDRPDQSTLADADKWCTRTAVIGARAAVREMPADMLQLLEGQAYRETPMPSLAETARVAEEPREDANAEQMVGFAMSEGFAMAAFMGMRVEAHTEHGPGKVGSLIRFDYSYSEAPGAPPVWEEFASQMRELANKVEQKAKSRGATTVQRVVLPTSPKGGN